MNDVGLNIIDPDVTGFEFRIRLTYLLSYFYLSNLENFLRMIDEDI